MCAPWIEADIKTQPQDQNETQGTLCTIDSTSKISKKPEHEIKLFSFIQRQDHYPLMT